MCGCMRVCVFVYACIHALRFGRVNLTCVKNKFILYLFNTQIYKLAYGILN